MEDDDTENGDSLALRRAKLKKAEAGEIQRVFVFRERRGEGGGFSGGSGEGEL